jgi:hypothetical protein
LLWALRIQRLWEQVAYFAREDLLHWNFPAHWQDAIPVHGDDPVGTGPM